MKATFCFQKVTPESAEHGEFSSHGFITPGLWEYPLQDELGHHKDVLDQAQSGDFDLTDLSEVISFAQSLGISYHPDADWFYSIDPDIDYSTGEETSYTLHIEGVTPSTYARIAKLLEQ